MLNQNIIKTALLGLKTKKADKKIFPDEVQPYLSDDQGVEELFLNGLSLTFQYLGSGESLPIVEKLSSQVPTCPAADEQPFASEKLLIAYDQAANNDFIRYSLRSFIQIITNKAITQNTIIPSDRLPQAIECLLEEKLIQSRKKHIEYPYRSFRSGYENLEKTIISSFGNTGQWIFDMMNPNKKNDITELDAKGRRAEFEKIWFEERDQALPFLEQFFPHDRLNNQKAYLRTIGLSLTPIDENITEFFQSYFENNTGKRIDELSKFYELILILLDENHQKRSIFESIFIEMWQSRSILSRELKIKQREDLMQSLAPLDDYPFEDVLNLSFTNLELKAYFLIQMIPIERACKLLKIKHAKYLSAISNLESNSKNKKYNPIKALIANVFRHNRLDIAKDILLLSNTINYTYWELLFLFPENEIIPFLEKNFKIIENINYDIFEIVITELRCKTPWTDKFTHSMMNHLLTNQSFYNSSRFYKALWLAGPYLPKNTNQIVINVAHSKLHQYAWKRMEIQTYINSVMNAKIALDNI